MTGIISRFKRKPEQTELNGKPLMFSNKDLRKLIIPLIIEQMLTMMVGLADTMMISYAGEAAISGVSLVDMINGVFIFLFSALATGGAVVVAQYIGAGDNKMGNRSASQLVTIATLMSIAFMLIGLLAPRAILSTLFGRVETDVMQASITYFTISAISYPFIAIYSSCTALFRSMGDSRTTMRVSIVMNIINVVGNAIAIFALQAGIAGVAFASLLARAVAAIIMLVLTLNKKNKIFVTFKEIFALRGSVIKRILRIAVPNGIENGMFQLSKVILTSVIALFGTTQIAANGVANSIDYVGGIIVMAISLAIVTVVGQCVGANNYGQAKFYTKKLIKISYISSIIWDIIITSLTPLILNLYSLSDETKKIAFILVILHNLFIVTIYPLSGPLSGAMRAAGDVKFTMVVSILATAVCRVFFAVVFGIWMNMGIIGVWLAMGLDWLLRAILFSFRYKSGKWTKFRIVE